MSDTKNDKSEAREGQRIAKVMARAGLCSRRDAEAWIAEGRVSVNGKVLESPAFNVSDDDDVRVDGQRLKEAERTRLFFFHKPRGLVTTARDPEGRPTIFEALPPDMPRVVAIGRLDINTEGLLLLTNDGGLARVLELPATGWLRRYRVRAHGEVTQAQLDGLREGVVIEGISYMGIEARLEREQGSNVWIMMGLREGKNREIKRVLEHLGLSVNRLIRVSFGPFELGELEEGGVAELNTRILRDQLGLKLAKQANANFDAPIEPRRPVAAPEPVREARRPVGARGSRPPDARGDRPPMRGREDKAVIAAELASRGQRKETTEPRKRKHVSILRAEARAEAEGPRKRIERGATADRKGREVKIERIKSAREPDAEPVRARVTRGTSGAKFERPGPKREFAPRGEGRPERAPRPFRESPRSAEGDARPARSGPRREFAAPTGEGRPFRAGLRRDDSAPREAKPERSGPKREFSGKREGAPARDGKPFRAAPRRDDAPREGRPERSGPKREFAGKREGGPAREGRPFRAAPGEGRSERSGPKREFAGKREGGPSREGKPFRAAPSRDGKPSGSGRPPPRGGSGGKPPGKRPPRKS